MATKEHNRISLAPEVAAGLSVETQVETDAPAKRLAFRATYHGPEKSTEGLIRVREITIIAPHFQRAHSKAQKNTPAGSELVKLEKLPDVIL